MKITIIGSGPGGYETALEAASRGCEVTLVSASPLGGTCLNEGCIPTKTFCGLSAPDQERKKAVIDTLQGGIASMLKAKKITPVFGTASFKDAHTVVVDGVEYASDAVIIATGSVNAALNIPGADLCIDSSAMLDLCDVPARLCVIGGGVIGLEFASIFRKFGSEVTVLEYAPGILPRFDADIAKRLKASLSRRGIDIQTSACVTAVERAANGSLSVAYTKKEEPFSVDADVVLMAVGRKPNLSSLNLSDIGVECVRGAVVTDENMCTNVPGVYAVGDIRGGMMLAHVATYEGRRALNHILGTPDSIDFSCIPAAVFTVPELATVGASEEDLKARGVEFEVHRSFWRANGKAVAMDSTDGCCKVLCEPDGGRILGVHMYGEHSSDIIHEAAVLVSLGVTLRRAADMIHAHPSLSEVLSAAIHS